MPRRAIRCFLTMCLLLSIVIIVQFVDRFINRLTYQSSIVVDRLPNNARKRGAESDKYSPIGSHEISARHLDVISNLTELHSEQNLEKSTQGANTTSSYNNNRLSFTEENNRSESLISTGVQERFDIFRRDWCQMQRARLRWKDVLGPCLNSTAWEEPDKVNVRLGINQITDHSKSFISHWDIKNAGEYSRFLIQTVSTSNTAKTIGGDSWRVHIHGPSSLAPTVLDLNNGTYEVLFLIIEDGDYEAKIFLDYSLCQGFKDPPTYWFRKGNGLVCHS